MLVGAALSCQRVRSRETLTLLNTVAGFAFATGLDLVFVDKARRVEFVETVELIFVVARVVAHFD